MSINKKSVLDTLSKIHRKLRKNNSGFDFFSAGGANPDNPVGKMTSLLGSVDPTSPDATENENSISDGKGGRIELELDKSRVKKK